MIVIEEGHIYRLEGTGHRIVFCKKEKVAGSDELAVVYDGTTNEEVIEVLLDRLDSLQKMLPCDENAHARNHLKQALGWLEQRTESRTAQKVEATNKPHIT